IALTRFAMPFARVQGGEETVTEETLPHHALSTAHVTSYPLQVLPRAQAEFKLNVIQQVKSVAIKNPKTFTGRLYKIIQLSLLHPRRCFWSSTFQSVPG